MRVKLRRPSPRALAIGLGVALALLVVVYEIGGNLVLSTGELARIVSAHPERTRLEYAHASTVWPGHFHVEGLAIRGRTPELEWELRIDQADVDISLFALFARRFHASNVVAKGAAFRFRFRVDPKTATADHLTLIPSIDGFDQIPTLGTPPDTRDPNAAHWAIEIENADVTAIREIWIDVFHILGDVHANGGFSLAPGHFALDPSHGTARDLTLKTGDDILVSGVGGDFDGTIDPVDLAQSKGKALLRYVTSHSAFEGKVGGIAFMRHFVDDTPPIEFAGGSGPFRGALRFEHGIIAKGSSAHIDLEPARVVVSGRAFEGGTRIDVSTGDDDGGTWGKIDVALNAFTFKEAGTFEGASTVKEGGAKIATASSATTSATLRVSSTDMAEPPRDIAYSWESPRVDVPDLRTIDRYLEPSEPFHFEGGKAAIDIRGQGTLHEVSAELGMASTVVMRVRGARVTSIVNGKVPMRADFAAKTLNLGGAALELASPAIGSGAANTNWSSNVKIDKAEIHISPPSVAASIGVSCRDGAPFIAMYAAMNDVSPATRAALAIVPDALLASMTAGAHGALQFTASPHAFDLHALDVRGASSRFRGELRKRGEQKVGGFLIEAGPASTGIAFDGTTSSLVVIDANTWFESHVARWRAL